MWFSQIAAKLKLLMQNLEKNSGNWNRMFQIYNKTSFIIVMLKPRDTRKMQNSMVSQTSASRLYNIVYKETCYIELNLWHLQSFTFFAKNVPHRN